jgi:uncharacterized protein
LGLLHSVHRLWEGGAAEKTIAPGALLFSTGALMGAVIGTGIGLRWMSERTTRCVFAAILLFAGFRLLLR